MIVKILASTLLVVSVVLGIFMVGAEVSDVNPKIWSFSSPALIGYDGNNVYFMAGYRMPFYIGRTQVGASMYSLQISIEYPSKLITGTYMTSTRLDQCVLYIVYDQAKMATLMRYPVDAVFSSLDKLFGKAEMSLILSDLAKYSDEKITRQAQGGKCEFRVDISRVPVAVVFIARSQVDDAMIVDSVNNKVLVSGDKLREALEEGEKTGLISIQVPSASGSPSPHPAVPPGHPQVATVTVPQTTVTATTAGPGISRAYVTYVAGVIGEIVSISINSSIDPGLYEYWRLFSVIGASLLLLVYDARRNPELYTGRAFSWVRWIASRLYASRGSQGRRGK
ncbi:MAG: hypothetical protein F7C07_04645 [Desulfurococcales archaeon]|nr:hypothetical protein [Desulfurococcales archaeon]